VTAPRSTRPSTVESYVASEKLREERRLARRRTDSAWKGAAWSILIGGAVWWVAVLVIMEQMVRWQVPDGPAFAIGALWPLTALGLQYLCARAFRRNGRPRAAYGVWIAAVAVLGLTSPCWLLLLTQ
jgi:hypothetical protein